MDVKDTCTYMYVAAIGMCAGAARMTFNPMVRIAALSSAALIGLIMSSSSDIKREALKIDSTKHDVQAATASVAQVVHIDDAVWQNNGKPEMQAALKKHAGQSSDTLPLFDDLTKILNALAGHSEAGAVAALGLGGIMLALARLTNTMILGPAAAPAQAVAGGASSSVLKTVSKVVAKAVQAHWKAGAIATVIAYQASQYLGTMSMPTGSLTEITGADPTFVQVSIPDLPVPVPKKKDV